MDREQERTEQGGDEGGHDDWGRVPEEQQGEPGAAGGEESGTKDRLPMSPSADDDDTPLGDTDQHSTAQDA